jgi:hypothetical protein
LRQKIKKTQFFEFQSNVFEYFGLNGSGIILQKKNMSVYEFFGLKGAIGYVGIVRIAITKNYWRF